MPLNCWEFQKCGRQPGGEHAHELGVCPAALETKCDRANHGANGGRVCWLVSGTRCGGEVQGTFAQKLASCANCSFYQQVREEEGPNCEQESELLMTLTDPAQIVRSYEELRSLYAKLKEAQAQLVHARKLEALGQFAEGIAHEINTPAQYIADNLKFLKEGFASLLAALQASGQLLQAAKATAALLPHTPASPAVADLSFLAENIPQAIDQSLGGIARLVAIVRAIREFSGSNSRDKLAADLHQLIQNAIMIARTEWSDVADVHTEFDPGMPEVPCIREEIGHAIWQVLINAIQAIRGAPDPSGGKGIIRITTRHQDGWVEVRICDTGPGIPKAIQHRIFEPFFSTREVGQGMGQGLYLAYSSVVKKHRGMMSFECPPGRGTTFIIRLPLTPAASAP